MSLGLGPQGLGGPVPVLGTPSLSMAEASATLHPTDMDIDAEDGLALDHEAPTEKTDADFFNGARAQPCPHTLVFFPSERALTDHSRLPARTLLCLPSERALTDHSRLPARRF